MILRTALAARPLQRAIVVLDFTGYAGPPDARHPLAGPLPAYLYDRNPGNDFPTCCRGACWSSHGAS
jgi:hypothetical protein